RVAEHRHPAEVEVVDGGQGQEMLGGPVAVVGRSGPPAAGADPAVLDVPGGEAPAGEVEGETVHEVAFPGVVPEPAVEEDHDRVATGGGGQPQVALLAGLGPVAQRVRAAVAAAGQEQDAVPAGVGTAPVEDPAAGGDERRVLRGGAGLAEVA